MHDISMFEGSRTFLLMDCIVRRSYKYMNFKLLSMKNASSFYMYMKPNNLFVYFLQLQIRVSVNKIYMLLEMGFRHTCEDVENQSITFDFCKFSFTSKSIILQFQSTKKQNRNNIRALILLQLYNKGTELFDIRYFCFIC